MSEPKPTLSDWQAREMLEKARVPRDAWRTTLSRESSDLKKVINSNFAGGDIHFVASKRMKDPDITCTNKQARLLFAVLAKEATILADGSAYMSSITPVARALEYRREDQKDHEGFFYDYYLHLFLFDFYDSFGKDAVEPKHARLLSSYIQERRMYSMHTHLFSIVRSDGESVIATYREDFVDFLAENYTEVRIKLA